MAVLRNITDIPDISEYTKENPTFKNSLIYKTGQNYNSSVSSTPSLTNQWYAVATSAQLPMDGNKKLFIQLYGEPIVIYRDSNGSVVACQDRCPHRSAPLSMGEIKNGVLMCRYHDWKFGENGKAVDIPAASKKKGGFVDKVSLFTIPCKEYNGLIYIYRSNAKSNQSDEKEPVFPENKKYNLIHKLDTNSHVIIGDLDGVWMHHVENLVDVAHTFFIHKNRAPFKTQSYKDQGPFLCKQYKDKRGYLLVMENYGFLRFDPPCTLMIALMNMQTRMPIDDGILLVRLVPINKNHTRALLRNYNSSFENLRKLVPFFDDFQEIESWRIFNEDNSVIAAQSVRVDLLGADIMRRPRGEDGNIPLIYKWWGEAIKNDKGEIWFKSWKCDEKKKIQCNAKAYGTDKVLVDDVKDIEDIMSEPMMVSTPWGDLSATACPKEFPPSNKAMFKQMERKLFMIKWGLISAAAGLVGFGAYKLYRKK